MVKKIFKWNYRGNYIHIAGTFNDWKPTPITHRGIHDNKLHKQFNLRPGYYEYKFIVDGVWCYDMLKPHTNDNHGGRNNYFRVERENLLCPICYGNNKNTSIVEFYCGHKVCENCFNKMEICFYRCP